MADKVTGLVIVSAPSGEPQAIPGIPGLWSTDEALAFVPEDHGMTLSDAETMLKGAGVEYRRVKTAETAEAVN